MVDVIPEKEPGIWRGGSVPVSQRCAESNRLAAIRARKNALQPSFRWIEGWCERVSCGDCFNGHHL